MDALKCLLILIIAAPVWMILHAIATAHNLGLVSLGFGLAVVIALLKIRTHTGRPGNPSQGEPQHRCRPSRSRRQDIGIEHN